MPLYRLHGFVLLGSSIFFSQAFQIQYILGNFLFDTLQRVHGANFNWMISNINNAQNCENYQTIVRIWTQLHPMWSTKEELPTRPADFRWFICETVLLSFSIPIPLIHKKHDITPCIWKIDRINEIYALYPEAMQSEQLHAKLVFYIVTMTWTEALHSERR